MSPADPHWHVNVTLQDQEIYFWSGSVRISHALYERSTASFEIRATKGQPQIGQTIGIFDHGKRIFGGRVSNVTLRPIQSAVSGSEARWSVECVGWEASWERHKIQAMAFTKMYAGDVVKQLLLYGISEFDEFIADPNGDIHQGVFLDTPIIFRGVSIWEAIVELAQRSNYSAWIDVDYFIHFVPREFYESEIEVRQILKNYRAPDERRDRADYYNAASMAISLDAFVPYKLDVQADVSYPQFQVYDPADATKMPLPIEAVKAIRINGVDQDFGIYGVDENKWFYFTQGDSWIYWDPANPVPSNADVITVEFWKVGQNVITVEDLAEQDAVKLIEAGAEFQEGSGRYHAYFEDYDEHSVEAATTRLNAFLNDHAPSRSGGDPGEAPVEYSWEMFSRELITDPPTGGSWNPQMGEIFPGKAIWYYPSTPTPDQDHLIIQRLEITGDVNYENFRYKVVAVPHIPIADSLEFYKTLAEIPTQVPEGFKDEPIIPNPHIGFGQSGAASAGVLSVYSEVTAGPGRVFRCREAVAHCTGAPSSTPLTVDIQYSTDAPSTAPGSRTWATIFDAASALSVPAGQQQMDARYGRFAPFPEPLDLPDRALVRCEITAASGATDVVAEVIGEIRKEEVTEEETEA